MLLANHLFLKYNNHATASLDILKCYRKDAKASTLYTFYIGGRYGFDRDGSSLGCASEGSASSSTAVNNNWQTRKTSFSCLRH